MYVCCSKSKVTQSISNYQEQHQITQNGRSLFTQRFIHWKVFTLGKKTQKNLLRMTTFSLWSFYEGVLYDNHSPKSATFEWSQKWFTYTCVTVYSIYKYKKKGSDIAKSKQNQTYCKCLFYALYYFSLEGFGNGLHKTLLFFSDIYWTPGFDRKGPMNKGLSIYPFVLLSGSFLWIGLLVFPGTQYVVRGPYDVVHDRARFFEKNIFAPEIGNLLGSLAIVFF